MLLDDGKLMAHLENAGNVADNHLVSVSKKEMGQKDKRGDGGAK